MIPKAFVVVKVEPPENRYNFSKFHDTIDEAKEEAVRLSGKYNGARFLVLQIVGYAEREPNPVKYIEA